VTVLLGAATAVGSARPDDASDPRRLRAEGLAGMLAELGVDAADLGDVAGLDPPWEAAPAGMRLRNVVPAIDQLMRIRGAVHAALVAQAPPIVLLGGDPLVSLGGVAGVRDALGDDPGLVWISPGAAFHTPETTPSGDLAGMALAVAVGLGARPLVEALDGPVVAPSSVLLVGAGVADDAEREALDDAGVRVVEGGPPGWVPEGPLMVAVDLRCLCPPSLGIDAARQTVLALAVREHVAAVSLTGATSAGATAVQVAALAAAALR
jgi:arginase